MLAGMMNEIDADQPLGKGFLVSLPFALKKVDVQVFKIATPARIQGILNSFQNEMNVVRPSLYVFEAYCMSIHFTHLYPISFLLLDTDSQQARP